MGRKGSTETITAILLAFLEQRTWTQKDLSRHCGVTTKTLKKHLVDLGAAGFPLHVDSEHPHVYWSVPRDWFPGAVAFHGDMLAVLVRVLRNSPHSETRTRLLDHIASSATGLRLAASGDGVVAGSLSREQEAVLWELEDCIEKRCAVRMRYYTMSRGAMAWRHVSVHRVLLGDFIRMVGTCHRDGALKWFRLENVWSAKGDESEPFRHADDTVVAAFVADSVDGFHSGQDSTECRFAVRLPEARWVKLQMNIPVTTVEGAAEYVFTARTAGLLPLARFLVGLGGAARCETPELAELVDELARGALSAS